MANKMSPNEQLEKIANDNNIDLKDEEFAKLLDEKDDLNWCREEFCYPKNKTLPPSKLLCCTLPTLVETSFSFIYILNSTTYNLCTN